VCEGILIRLCDNDSLLVSRSLKDIVETRGIGGLYRGSFAPVMTKALSCGVCFGVVGTTKKALGAGDEDPLSLSCLIAYGFSGVIESSFYTPIELIKVRLQTSNISFRETISKVLANRELYRGLTSCMTRESFGNIAFFGFYYKVKTPLIRFRDETKSKVGNRAITCIAGAAAGIGYWLAVFPIDSCKTMIQAHGKKYRGLFHCASSTWRNHGFARFYYGLSPCLIRAAPVSMVIFLSFEEIFPIVAQQLGA